MGQTRPEGGFVRVFIHGVAVPTNVVTRTSNWGFALQSCWTLYASFPIPPPGDCPELMDENMTDLTMLQEREIFFYNMGMNFDPSTEAVDTVAPVQLPPAVDIDHALWHIIWNVIVPPENDPVMQPQVEDAIPNQQDASNSFSESGNHDFDSKDELLQDDETDDDDSEAGSVSS
jgi:hypothetical protein